MSKKQSSDGADFDKVMEGLLAVPYKELQAKLEEEKRTKARRKSDAPIPPSSHASSGSKKQDS